VIYSGDFIVLSNTVKLSSTSRNQLDYSPLKICYYTSWWNAIFVTKSMNSSLLFSSFRSPLLMVNLEAKLGVKPYSKPSCCTLVIADTGFTNMDYFSNACRVNSLRKVLPQFFLAQTVLRFYLPSLVLALHNALVYPSLRQHSLLLVPI
jgi:hypothetical protein